MTVLEKWDVPQPVKLTIEDFVRLEEAGAFRAYAKTELIGGTIVAMNAQFSTHARVKSRLFRRIADAVDAMMPGFETWSEVSIAIPPRDLPEPDIIVTNYQALGRTSVPADTIALIVEIADTTKSYDLGTKAELYAAGCIPEYWVVDIEGDTIHQLWVPVDGTYAERREITLGAEATAVTIADLSIDTRDL